MKKVKFQLEELTCPSCINKIEGILSKQTGVIESKVLFHSNKVKVDYDEMTASPDTLREVIEKLGYPVLRSE